jgi:hypothetical protein
MSRFQEVCSTALMSNNTMARMGMVARMYHTKNRRVLIFRLCFYSHMLILSKISKGEL